LQNDEEVEFYTIRRDEREGKEYKGELKQVCRGERTIAQISRNSVEVGQKRQDFLLFSCYR
jgi:hypothetical protein